MNIVLLGSTGFVGSALLAEALSREHTVTAIVRNAQKLEKRDRLVVKTGDIYNSTALASLIAGNEALISAFNPGWQDPHLHEDQVRGTTSILTAVRLAAISRVLWVGGAGGLKNSQGVRLLDTEGFPTKIKPGSLATADALEQLRKEPTLAWSYLAPSADMHTGGRTGHFRLGDDTLLVDSGGRSSISVQVYAVAMIDELEYPAHLRQRFTVGY
jgi:hypothetical protein